MDPVSSSASSAAPAAATPATSASPAAASAAATTLAAAPDLRRAAFWMAGWLVLMVVIAVAGRQAMRELSLFQILWMRSWLGLAMLWPLVHAAGGIARLRTQRLPLHAARNLVHYAAQYGWFAALALIPLGQVVAIEFTMPIWAALLAVLWLGERMGPARIAAVLLGLVGVAVIVRPWAAAGGGAGSAGQWIALAAAIGFAVSVVMVKSLTRTEPAVAVSAWMAIIQGLIGTLPALWLWRWPGLATWGWVLLVAFCGTYSHYCYARAMAHADATVVVPMDFLRVPLSALAGWAVYDERIDLLTVLGMVLILAGNGLNLRPGAGRR